MLRAIKLSQESIVRNGGPFGCTIVKNSKIIAEGINKVTSSNDPTAHAEIVAIRNACQKLHQRETHCKFSDNDPPTLGGV